MHMHGCLIPFVSKKEHLITSSGSLVDHRSREGVAPPQLQVAWMVLSRFMLSCHLGNYPEGGAEVQQSFLFISLLLHHHFHQTELFCYALPVIQA